jgi:hypothetical protein
MNRITSIFGALVALILSSLFGEGPRRLAAAITSANMTTQSDLVIYEDELETAFMESLGQKVAAITEGTGNAIEVSDERLKGDFKRRSMFKRVSGPLRRRDPNSEATVSPQKLVADEEVGVKIRVGYGPIDVALTAMKDIGDEDGMRLASQQLGKQMAEDKAQDMMNTGVMALLAAIENVPGLLYDAVADAGETSKILTPRKLAKTRRLFTDQWAKLRFALIHGVPFHDLNIDAINSNTLEVGAMAILTGGFPSLGFTPAVSDVPALFDDTPDPDQYTSLLLRPGALRITNSEAETVVTEIVTGRENLFARVQGEWGYTIEVDGFKWDTTAGGRSPNDATLATPTNWIKVFDDIRNLPGVRCLHQ